MRLDGPNHRTQRGQAPTRGKSDGSFSNLDRNGDGVLRGKELLVRGGAKYSARDLDGDGKVTRRESRTSFTGLDSNKDRFLSSEEAKKLSRHDADGDGRISAGEFEEGLRADVMRARQAIRRLEFNQFDDDGDGALTGAEAKEIRGYDGDGDGRITEAEYTQGTREAWRARVDERQEQRFEKADRDGDGKLKGDEATRYADYDLDRDGRVSRLEFKSGQEAERKGRVSSAIQGRSVNPEYREAFVDTAFKSRDRNGDGRLEAGEMKRVQRFDADGDGAVTRDELAAGLARPLPDPKAPDAKGATDFVLSSFNVLSSGAGNSKGFRSGTERIRDVVKILKANDVSVAGFQEMDHRQLEMFKKLAGDEYGTFAGASGKPGYHDTALAWRKDTWKLEKSGTITVPSYGGKPSKVPYVRLRNKETGQEAFFIDVHNPANTKRYHHQERFRDAAARKEADLAKRLFERTGLPVFVTGDMNSVGEAREIFTNRAPLKAANPRGKAGIDWIFGTHGTKFSKFRRTRDGLIGRTTDHPVVFTNVKINRDRYR